MSLPIFRVLVADPHPLVQEGLFRTIEREHGFQVISAVGSAAEMWDSIPRVQPHILTLEIALDHGDSLELIKSIKTAHPALRILIITSLHEECFAERALRAGADGFVDKKQPWPCILHALRTVAGGGIWCSPQTTARLLRHTKAGALQAESCPLSDREIQVFRLIGSGLRTGAIARELGVSVKTVDTHRNHLKTKLHLTDGAALVHRAREWVQRGCSQCAAGRDTPQPLRGAAGPFRNQHPDQENGNVTGLP